MAALSTASTPGIDIDRYGLSKCQRLEVWLTSDQIAQADHESNHGLKGHKEFVESIAEESSRISIHLLEDEDGPAPGTRMLPQYYAHQEH